jgi:hypothetical protein
MITYDYDSNSEYISPMDRVTQNTTGNGKYITHKYLAYGDYDNSCSVERANVDYIIDNYAKNRYVKIIGSYGYTQIYLKNTKLNRELIENLDRYPSIDDDYLYQWESSNSLDQFLESNLSDYPVIYQALEKIDPDLDWTPSPELYNCIIHFSAIWFGGEVYIFQGARFYFNLEKTEIATVENINTVYDYLLDNPIYSQLDKTSLINNTQSIIDRLYKDSQTADQPYYYCLQLQSYSFLTLFGGSSDYMSSHYYPFQEIIIDPKTTKRDIIELLYHTYTMICDDNYEQLDKLPVWL